MADHSPNPATIVEELLSAYMDGRATDDERRQAEALLATDPTAARTLVELRYTVGLLAETPPVPLPRAFTLSERHVQPAAATRSPWLAWLTPVYLRGAAALVAICLLVLVIGDPGLRPQPQPEAQSQTSTAKQTQDPSTLVPSVDGKRPHEDTQKAAEEATETATTATAGLSPETMRVLQVTLALLLVALLVASLLLNRLT